MITFQTSGSFQNTDKFLGHLLNPSVTEILDRYGKEGVALLANATPSETGLTAASWGYEVKKGRGFYAINWYNTNVVNGTPIAILIQYGHGTGTGGYVQGRDYINPTLRPLFDKISEDVWKAVTSA